jgi:hypothetical protein
MKSYLIFIFSLFLATGLRASSEGQALSLCQGSLVAPSEEAAHELYLRGAALYNSAHFTKALIDEMLRMGSARAHELVLGLRDAAKLQKPELLRQFAEGVSHRLIAAVKLNYNPTEVRQAQNEAAKLGLSYDEFLRFLVEWREERESDPQAARLSELIYYLILEQSHVLAKRVEEELAKRRFPNAHLWLRRYTQGLRPIRSEGAQYLESEHADPKAEFEAMSYTDKLTYLRAQKYPPTYFLRRVREVTQATPTFDLSDLEFLWDLVNKTFAKLRETSVVAASPAGEFIIQEKLEHLGRIEPELDLLATVISRLKLNKFPLRRLQKLCQVKLKKYFWIKTSPRLGQFPFVFYDKSKEQVLLTEKVFEALIDRRYQEYLKHVTGENPFVSKDAQGLSFAERLRLMRKESEIGPHRFAESLQRLVNETPSFTHFDLSQYLDFMHRNPKRLSGLTAAPSEKFQKLLAKNGYTKNPERVPVELVILATMLEKVELWPQTVHEFTELLAEGLKLYDAVRPRNRSLVGSRDPAHPSADDYYALQKSYYNLLGHDIWRF